MAEEPGFPPGVSLAVERPYAREYVRRIRFLSLTGTRDLASRHRADSLRELDPARAAGLGPEATADPTMVEQLVAALGDDVRWERAAARLVLLRSEATMPLAARLRAAVKSGEAGVEARILSVLARLGVDAGEATGVLRSVLNDLGDDAFRGCFAAISQITPGRGAVQLNGIMVEFHKSRFRRQGNNVVQPSIDVSEYVIDPEAAVKDLVRGLQENQRKSRGGYCQLLGQRGKEARSALGVLGSVLRGYVSNSPGKEWGPSIDTRFAGNAAVAILHIDPLSKEAAYAYGYSVLAEPFRDLRLRAARELMASPHIALAAPFLVEFLRRGSDDADLTHAVLSALTLIGPEAAPAIPYLEKMVAGDDTAIAAKAKTALARIRKPAADAERRRRPVVLRFLPN